MMRIGIFRLEKYILFERLKVSCDVVAADDNRVHIVSSLDQIKGHRLNLDEENTSRLLKKNVTMFVYSEEGEHLGMMCGYKGSCYVRGAGIPLYQDEDSIYWFWIYTVPEWRRKGVFTKLKNAFFAHYRDAPKIAALVEHSNSLMRQEMKKMGFREKKTYFVVKVGAKAMLIEKNLITGRLRCYFDRGGRNDMIYI